jgi:hypothetical protein
MIKSFGRPIATGSGVDPEKVLTVRINLPDAAAGHGASHDGSTAFFSELEQRVAGLPGVTSTGMANCHALAGGCNVTIIRFRDRPPVPRGAEPSVGVLFASPDFFKTLKIPLLRGRWFTTADRQGAPKVVLVSDVAARKFWPGENPIGKPIANRLERHRGRRPLRADGRSAQARRVRLVFAIAAQQPGLSSRAPPGTRWRSPMPSAGRCNRSTGMSRFTTSKP